MARPPLHLVTYPKITLAPVSGVRSVTVKIPYAHLNYSHTIEIANSLYLGAKESGKSASVPAGIGDAWLDGYYKAFVFDSHLAQFYPALLTPFRKIRRELNLDSDRYLELLTAYVQGLPYDKEKLASIEIAPRFPVETAVDGTGICSDKSLLLAGMLSQEGYACALLHFGKENHLAVGIPAPAGFDFKKTGYAVIETTAVSYIGSDPCTETKGSLVTRPKVVPVGNGTKTYSAIRDTAKILAVIRELEEKLDPHGTMVSELLRLKESVENQTEILRGLKDTIEHDEELTDAEEQELRETAGKKLQRLQKTIHQYNGLAGEFARAQELASFLRANRLDRQAVVKRLRQIHPGFR
ncbi:MAG: hypothetical protein IKY81_01990 [Methanocorpusculum sp.]|nr:hypothetical protein [Methanocorpusculum sp.]